jgi:hypothetical protein
MAQFLHIRCVVRTDRTNAHERIHSVGGVKPDGSRWKPTQNRASSYIQDGTYVISRKRLPYLKTPRSCGSRYIPDISIGGSSFFRAAPPRGTSCAHPSDNGRQA